MGLFELLEEFDKLYDYKNASCTCQQSVNTRTCECDRQIRCESLVSDSDKTVFRTVLPMLKSENISVHIQDGDTLRVSLLGLKEDTEFVPKDYHRDIKLGERCDTEAITAEYADGILTVTIPMRKPKTQKKIDIKVK